MRLVILESPWAGDIETNKEYARACVRDSLSRGEAPLASHLMYAASGVLDDDVWEQRILGMQAGLEWGRVAEATVVYTDRGISAGMKHGIAIANHFGRPVEYRKLKVENKNVVHSHSKTTSENEMR